MNSSRTPRAVVRRLSLLVETLCGDSSTQVALVHSKAAPSVAKRTKTGLFAGRRILSGNNVSEDGGNRTRRTWKPNAQSATLYSELLDKTVRVKVTPAALRSIDKSGGLDVYVLNSKDAADNALRKQLVEARALKGYFGDEYVRHFVKKSDAVRARSLPPLINRGYYARHTLIRSLLLHFLEFSKPSAVPAQVVILGCGFDTLYFQLRDAGEIDADVLYVECDFPDVVEAKRSILGGLGLGEQERHSLIGADLRDVDGLMAKLHETGICRDAPTFFLAECVLVYMDVGDSNSLLGRFSSDFRAAMAVVYEQVNPNDPFGRQMMFNLRARGCPLKGVLESLEAQRQRMTQCGWEDARSEDLLRLFKMCIPRAEIARINRLEMMDEEEEWNLLLRHYSITTARNGSLIPLFRDIL